MAGTGFDATIMESTPEELKGRVGPLAYIISGLRAMRGRRARVSIAIDGGPPLRRSTRMVVVGNTGTLVGGLALMPDAVHRRRLLDVVSLAPKGWSGWMAVAARVVTRNRRGGQAHRALAGAARSSSPPTSPQPAQVDGDLIGEARELRIWVDAGALVVRVPGRRPMWRRPNVGVVRTVQVIGIGAGDPDHLTLQAVAALRRTDVFLRGGQG